MAQQGACLAIRSEASPPRAGSNTQIAMSLAFTHQVTFLHVLAFIAMLGLVFTMPFWIGVALRGVGGMICVALLPLAWMMDVPQAWGRRRRAKALDLLGVYLPQLVARGHSASYYQALVESGMTPHKLTGSGKPQQGAGAGKGGKKVAEKLANNPGSG